MCGSRKYLSIHPQKCRLYIFWSFGIVGIILIQFENRATLKQVLGELPNSNSTLHYCTWTDSRMLFLFLWRVSCLQRLFIQSLFYKTWPVHVIELTKVDLSLPPFPPPHLRLTSVSTLSYQYFLPFRLNLWILAPKLQNYFHAQLSWNFSWK